MGNDDQVIDILLVDDGDDDVVIAQRAFKKGRILNNLYIVRSGQEALDFIYHEGEYQNSSVPTPGLILLDINMPNMNGFQVLEKLKSSPKYRMIPVIMLTISDRDEDIVRSYRSGAVSYITKPINFEEFVRVIEQFEIYWSLVSKIPRVVWDVQKQHG
ncbi:MAG: response regulator [bacterium]|nr:response regulator [bacterium]